MFFSLYLVHRLISKKNVSTSYTQTGETAKVPEILKSKRCCIFSARQHYCMLSALLCYRQSVCLPHWRISRKRL